MKRFQTIQFPVYSNGVYSATGYLRKHVMTSMFIFAIYISNDVIRPASAECFERSSSILFCFASFAKKKVEKVKKKPSVTVCRFVIFLYIALSPKKTILTAHPNEQILEGVRPIFEFFEREVKIGLARKENTKISLLGMSLT